MNENFTDVPAVYKNDYVVFRTGSVWSRISQRFLSPRVHTHGYTRLTIRRRDEYIHRIVATCFVDNPHGYTEVNHIDGDKKNNHASNLEWCTRQQNNKHAFATGLRDYAELKRMANSENHKLARRKRRIYDDDTVLKIKELLRNGVSDREISKIVGGTRNAIYSLRTGKTYKEYYEHSNTAN
ncbi:MAG: HNH endonuclease [Thermoguttaceae bacterium]